MSTRPCTVRTAAPRDLDAVEALRRRWAEETRYPGAPIHPAARAVMAASGRPGLRVLVAETHGGAPVGFVSSCPALDLGDGPGAWLSDLYVVPEARRRGVGRALVGALAAAARMEGALWLFWHAARSDPGAQGFYGALGGRPREDHLVMALSGDALAGLG